MSVRLSFILLLFITSIAGAQTTGIVYFNFNSTVLTNEARTDLNKVVNAKNTRSLGIFGHTDQVGSDAYNEWLSLERARVVRDYLLSKGLGAEKISVVLGFGARRLITNDKDSSSMRLNRRVVLMNGYTPTQMDKDIAASQEAINRKFVAVTNTTPANAPASQAAEQTQQTVSTPKEAPVVKQQKNEKLVEDIKDKTTKAGEHIVLKNINFHPGRNSFLESAYPALKDLLEAMQKIPTLEIEIQGHVCCTEDESDALDVVANQHKLSVTRAEAVYDYLINNGVSKNRLSYKGLARQYPLVKVETTEEDRIANRRVEIKIVKK